ncbi:unnamed protein product [Schistosoma mattheei]|uniref:Uncharacterized protein n=1 Tax=Schistosoma mattheei TaxID=31246 RepID=A0A3P8KZ43_9TREM|nr:unnamed protein product [Schistosoma mattheei]
MACQSLPHYSDFDTTSESGLSDLSYVLPYRPKKSLTRNKPVKVSPGEIRLGARAMRRYENEVYLNTLAVITETDGDNIDDCWPESFNYCSTFTKLLEDENYLEMILLKCTYATETEQRDKPTHLKLNEGYFISELNIIADGAL